MDIISRVFVDVETLDHAKFVLASRLYQKMRTIRNRAHDTQCVQLTEVTKDILQLIIAFEELPTTERQKFMDNLTVKQATDLILAGSCLEYTELCDYIILWFNDKRKTSVENMGRQ